MTQEPRIVSFTITESFDIALRMLRRALAREGLRIPCEVSTSARLRSELGVGLKDNMVLYVDAPLVLLEATVFTGAASLYVPEPVVLSACSSEECKVTVRSIKPLLDESLPATVGQSLVSLHERILKAIQTIGQREAVIEHAQAHEAVLA